MNKLFLAFLFFVSFAYCLDDLVTTVQNDNDLAGLLDLVANDNTVLSALQAAENVTLFAPVGSTLTPDANILNQVGYNATLLLFYHVVNGRNNAADFTNDMTYATLTGDSIRFNSYSSPFNQVNTVNGVPIQEVDIEATNGVIHKVESILYPPTGSVLDIASSLSDFSILVSVVGKASTAVQNALAQDKITVFAPTNAAFEAINATLGGGLGDLDQATIDKILTYHVVGATVFSAALPTTIDVTTANGEDFTIDNLKIQSVNPIAEEASIVTPDVLATNGVIHVIDKVLVPTLTPATDVATASPTEAPTEAPDNTQDPDEKDSSASTFMSSFATLAIAIMAAMY